MGLYQDRPILSKAGLLGSDECSESERQNRVGSTKLGPPFSASVEIRHKPKSASFSLEMHKQLHSSRRKYDQETYFERW